jgi:hypothetical protein
MSSTCGNYGYYAGLFYDWQTLVAGSLALLAGLGAIIAANRQVKAANEQTATMRLIERERIARETYAFFAVFEAAMQSVIDDAEEAEKMFANEPADKENSIAAYEARQQIKKTAFEELRSAFLRHGDKLVTPFLRLEKQIDKFAAQWRKGGVVVGELLRLGIHTGLTTELCAIKKGASELREKASEGKARAAADLAKTQKKQ